MKKRRLIDWVLPTALLFLLLLVVVAFALSSGPTGLTTERSILWNIRVPRALLGFAVGGSLSLAGVILQGLFRNPLVEPYTLGISGGAALGVAVNIILRFNQRFGVVSLPLFGFAGACIVVFVLYLLSLYKKSLKVQSILLTGVMVSFVCSALMMLLLALSRSEDLHGIILWTMGSLEEPSQLLVNLSVVVSLLGLFFSYLFVRDLNAFWLGEEEALHLGVNIERSKRLLFILASFLTGVTVSVAGIIGFVGLVVPHLVRLLFGNDHRILLVGSFLTGATFLIFCDTLARTVIVPLELPVGVITGILGGTLFIYVLTRQGSGFKERL
ncbi:MAG: iron ABC transporter permease [bacterium (Candidatus Ratteibacteria) CG23_combo_of_CG06-09_8_20_14_all_48_7]|uniref:Iron ABC transporter permease n=1 Tax=bacterium (Candidatus Ratteibacteria) CG23_combo_of_CG06-09_8_20_14_all_48_7 TaxID=2014292 RepID=A0A2G9YAT9_9BACT|nr:MAG: iron ABC transporter permease [bacterium (Candidatus Ratteibacteria) CG23_combo_of_CG06-09_8_20_14_all_48_7]